MADDSELRDYAQQENEHLLSLLLRPKPGQVEDPQKLAERNCRATAASFGESDPLHAMALNTLAFVHLHKHQDAGMALDLAVKAVEFLRGRSGQEELLLESECLAVLAKTRLGFAGSSAIQEVFPLPAGHPSPSSHVRTAAQSLSEILAASLLEPRLKRYLLLMALRDIALELLRELESSRESEAHESLQNNLVNFLELYFGAKEESK
jgi:hypothetical protein